MPSGGGPKPKIEAAIVIGKVLGQFEILGKLGEGGMSARGPASERSETSRQGAGVGPRATRTK